MLFLLLPHDIILLKEVISEMRYSKKLRERAMLTVNELAEAANVSVRTIYRIEAGTYKLSDKMNLILVRTLLPNLEKEKIDNEGYMVKENKMSYSDEIDAFTMLLYNKLPEETQVTLSIEQLDTIIKSIN